MGHQGYGCQGNWGSGALALPPLWERPPPWGRDCGLWWELFCLSFSCGCAGPPQQPPALQQPLQSRQTLQLQNKLLDHWPPFHLQREGLVQWAGSVWSCGGHTIWGTVCSENGSSWLALQHLHHHSAARSPTATTSSDTVLSHHAVVGWTDEHYHLKPAKTGVDLCLLHIEDHFRIISARGARFAWLQDDGLVQDQDKLGLRLVNQSAIPVAVVAFVNRLRTVAAIDSIYRPTAATWLRGKWWC